MCISIIIPCYNLENYLERCLNSIIWQEYDKTKYEIIIVFDSCTDSSRKVALNCLKGSGIHYRFLTTKVRSAGLARNVGLEQAKGKYVWFIDGDDYLLQRSAFTKLVAKIEATQSLVVYQKNFVPGRKVKDDEAIWRYFFLRSAIGDIRFTDLEINEDWEFVRAVLGNIPSGRVVTIEDYLYHYTHQREGSITYLYRERLGKG